MLTMSGCYSCKGVVDIPPEAKTVSVQYFQNNAPLAPPTLSPVFTEALRDHIGSQARLTQVTKGGDLQFEGQITGYNTAPVAIQSNDQAALNRLTITVSVKYTNRFNEEKGFETSFSRFADYPSTQTLSAVEADLIREINRQLVDDIFNRAFNNW
jgi:hypothetical protein